jgi:hypothetical protein
MIKSVLDAGCGPRSMSGQQLGLAWLAKMARMNRAQYERRCSRQVRLLGVLRVDPFILQLLVLVLELLVLVTGTGNGAGVGACAVTGAGVDVIGTGAGVAV